MISTVDPQARHGHKTAARGFDGYKGHVAIDPDSEIITATTVTPGNTGDAAAAPVLITDLLPDVPAAPQPAEPTTVQDQPAADDEPGPTVGIERGDPTGDPEPAEPGDPTGDPEP
ncbi:MAG: transposase, partial [Actinomycetota bacterium]|nr:transposase [Actinomycetota bacterium]